MSEKLHNLYKTYLEKYFDPDTFRSDERFTNVAEPNIIGPAISMFEASKDFIKKHLKILQKIDKIGNPKLYTFEDKYRLSANTVKLAHIASRLEELYGSLDNYTVLEVGAKYGALAMLLTNIYKIKSYEVITDIPVVTMEYCNEVVKVDAVPTKKYDLVLSINYFNELKRNTQQTLLDKLSFTNCYLLVQDTSNMRTGESLTFDELKAKFGTASIVKHYKPKSYAELVTVIKTDTKPMKTRKSRQHRPTKQ